MDLARSLLFVPGHRRNMVDKALGLARLDVAILDLEDGVPPAEKNAAREIVAEALARPHLARPARFVRVNPVRSDDFAADIARVVRAGAAGIVLPKIESAEDVLAADRLVAARAPGVSLVASIESAKGLLNAPAIAATSAHVSGLMFGAEDWASDLGLPAGREGEGRELLYPRSAVVVAATAAGILAFDSVWPDIRDLAGLRDDSVLARRLGFSGKTCVHPDQIAAINEAFTPSDAEAARARGIVAAFEEATRRGAGVTEFEGQLVDRPVVERALRALRAWDLARSQSV